MAKENGKVLITSGELSELGAPTFDAWIVRKDFAEKHPDAVRAFAKVTLDAYADYRKDPQAWLANPDNIAKVVKLSGAKAAVSYTHLDVYKRQPKPGTFRCCCRATCSR